VRMEQQAVPHGLRQNRIMPRWTVRFNCLRAWYQCPQTQYQLQNDITANLYNFTYEATEACPKGTITVRVLDSEDQPIVGNSLGFLLVGDQTQYSGSSETDSNGEAVFDFTASQNDAGATRWCSIAMNNPDGPSGNQQASCVVSVCENPNSTLVDQQ
jgi:hypothetical protein